MRITPSEDILFKKHMRYGYNDAHILLLQHVEEEQSFRCIVDNECTHPAVDSSRQALFVVRRKC